MKLSDAAQTMLVSRLASAEKLEIVMALHASRGRAVPIERLAAELRVSGRELRHALRELGRHMLVHETADREVLLLPPSMLDAAALDELFAAHSRDKQALHALLAERAIEQVREHTKGDPR